MFGRSLPESNVPESATLSAEAPGTIQGVFLASPGRHLHSNQARTGCSAGWPGASFVSPCRTVRRQHGTAYGGPAHHRLRSVVSHADRSEPADGLATPHRRQSRTEQLLRLIPMAKYQSDRIYFEGYRHRRTTPKNTLDFLSFTLRCRSVR